MSSDEQDYFPPLEINCAVEVNDKIVFDLDSGDADAIVVDQPTSPDAPPIYIDKKDIGRLIGWLQQALLRLA